MALLGEAQKPEGSLTSNVLTPRQPSGSGNIERSKTTPQTVSEVEDKYLDLYLPVAENYRISDRFMDIWTVCPWRITEWYWWN